MLITTFLVAGLLVTPVLVRAEEDPDVRGNTFANGVLLVSSSIGATLVLNSQLVFTNNRLNSSFEVAC
jgi:hypothetical protein